jgi:hypothetical protein
MLLIVGGLWQSTVAQAKKAAKPKAQTKLQAGMASRKPVPQSMVKEIQRDIGKLEDALVSAKNLASMKPNKTNKAKVTKVQRELTKAKADLRKVRRMNAAKNLKTGDRVRFSKNYSVQEGMGLDPITGRGVRAASDVDKGRAGKVTRSAEPGFLQQQRTAGSRAKAARKVELDVKKREGTATKVELEELKDLRTTDAVDTRRARSRAADTLRATAAKKRKEVDHFAVAVNRKTGEINEESFNKLTPNQQKLLIQDIKARFSTPRAREILARIDELEPTKAGETGVRRRRQGKTYGMRGANRDDDSRIKDIDEGVSRGRGGLDFKKGGMAKKGVPVVTVGIGMMPTPKGKKPRTGAKDFRNGGMVMATKNNLKPVPAGNKGLKKLPAAVRNKMGFMKKGGMVKK